MDLTAEQICREQKIDLAYLRKISHAGYAEAAEAYAEDGTYVLPDTTAYRQVPSYRIFGYQNARRLMWHIWEMLMNRRAESCGKICGNLQRCPGENAYW